MRGKPVSASAVEVMHLVLPSDTNALGNIFGGRLMSWADLAAAIVANRHTRRTCVTASMDDLDFFHPVRKSDIVILKAAVNYTGRTSLEIGVRVEAENPLSGERRHTASAYLTFVALDEKGKTVEIPPIIPQTEEEKRRFGEAQERREMRQRRVLEKRKKV